MPGACGHWVGARGALASLRGRSGASGQRAPANRRRRSARAPRCWELAKLVAFDAGSAAGLVGAPRAPRDGEEVGNHHSNCTYTSDPTAPRLGSEQGAGSADPTHRARETGRHNARLLEQASYLQVQSNNPAWILPRVHAAERRQQAALPRGAHQEDDAGGRRCWQDCLGRASSRVCAAPLCRSTHQPQLMELHRCAHSKMLGALRSRAAREGYCRRIASGRQGAAGLPHQGGC